MMMLSNLAILGSVIGIITNLFPVDPTPFVGSVTATLCALILYRYWMSDVVRTGLSQAVEQMGDAIVVADRDGMILDANHAFGQLVGMDRALLVGIPVDQAVASLSARMQGSTSLPEILFSSTWDSPCPVSRDVVFDGEGGSSRSYSLTAWPILDKRGAVLGRTLTLRDVTEARALTDGLAQLLEEAKANATTDVLTGLPNHRHLMDRLDQEEAVAELKKGAGTQFDPDLLRSFLKALGYEPDLPAPPAGVR